MKEKLVGELRLSLQKSSDSKIQDTSSRFFKKGEEALVFGVKTSVVNQIARDFLKQLQCNE